MPTTTRTLPFDQPNALTPPPAYAELRAATPVARVITPDGQPAWLVTAYDTVTRVLADPRFGVAPAGAPMAGNDTLFQDGAPHTRLRRLVSKVFTPRRIAALRPRVEQLAADQVAAIAAAGPPTDLVDTLAAPLSITVIGELLGVAIAERESFRRWADAAFVVDTAAGGNADPAAMEQAWGGLYAYVGGLVAAKREQLGDDLTSDLIAVRDSEDGRLSDDELLAMVATLISAGYLSSCNAISVGAIQLITTGRLPELAAAAPDRVDAFVEELLRRQTGLTGEALPRWAHDDVELDGVRISAGEMVLVRLGAANRDPRQFTDPDQLVPDRPTNPHLAFGHGPHHCLGAALARLEVGIALRAIARRLPGLRLDGPVEEIQWSEGQIDVGPVALRVSW